YADAGWPLRSERTSSRRARTQLPTTCCPGSATERASAHDVLSPLPDSQRAPLLGGSVLIPHFPDEPRFSAWYLRQNPGKPSVSDPFLPKRPRNPMGDSPNDPPRVDFDRQIKLEFHGSTVTSDAGLLAYRELDDALGLTSTAASGLPATRRGQNPQPSLLALWRQSIYSRLAGYEKTSTTPSASASIRRCGPWSVAAPRTTTAASTSEMGRFETETLSTKENLKYL